MKTQTHITRQNLIQVLKELKETKKFNHSTYDLQERHVMYATQLNSFLRKSEIIDSFGNLIKDININSCASALRNYGADRQKFHREKKFEQLFKYQDVQKSDSRSPQEKSDDFLSELTDIELVKELRNRGFEISAKKLIDL